MRAALVFQHQKLALDRPDRGGRDVAVAQRQVGGVLPDPDQHRLQVLQVKERQPLLVGQPEGDIENPLLRLAQVHQPREQERPHLGHGGANRMALFAEEIPEGDREGLVLQVIADGGAALHEGVVQLAGGRSGDRDAGKIALHVRQEDRYAGRRKALGENLERHRLAGPGRARDQTVAVSIFQQEFLRRRIAFAPAPYKNPVFGQHLSPPETRFGRRDNTTLTGLCQP